MSKTLVMTVTVLESGVINYTMIDPQGNTACGQRFPNQKTYAKVVPELAERFSLELAHIVEATKL